MHTHGAHKIRQTHTENKQILDQVWFHHLGGRDKWYSVSLRTAWCIQQDYVLINKFIVSINKQIILLKKKRQNLKVKSVLTAAEEKSH